MIIRTDALVLRGMDYRETSRIVTLYTQEKGKISVLARGARRPGSRFGATLQPMACTQVVFYYKPTRGLQTLTESAHLHRFPNIARDMEKIVLGLRIVELLNALLQEEQQLPGVLSLSLEALTRLDAATTRAANVLPCFQLRLASLLGFAPAFDRDVVQNLPDDGGLLRLDTGAVLTLDQTTGPGHRASRAALRAFAVFARADFDTVMRMHLQPAIRRTVNDLIDAYLRYHVEAAYPTRSDRVMEHLLGGGPPASG